jgi:hypothetical protein
MQAHSCGKKRHPALLLVLLGSLQADKECGPPLCSHAGRMRSELPGQLRRVPSAKQRRSRGIW